MYLNLKTFHRKRKALSSYPCLEFLNRCINKGAFAFQMYLIAIVTTMREQTHSLRNSDVNTNAISRREFLQFFRDVTLIGTN